MGSKNKIAKYILPIILHDRKPRQWYVEPFMGGCNTLANVGGYRAGNDINYYLTAMWEALSEGWIPPEIISEEYYTEIKNNQSYFDPKIVGFVGISCSFGAKWFGGYARNSRGTNYAMEGRCNLLKQSLKLRGTKFVHGDYLNMYIPNKSIIYCDPPYADTTKYNKPFDSTMFWNWAVSKISEGHKIFISEYKAPKDFIPIWEQPVKHNLQAHNMVEATEKLFVHHSQLEAYMEVF